MIGLHVQTVRGVAQIPRASIGTGLTSVSSAWPAGRSRVRTEGDIPASQAQDSSVYLDIRFEVFLGGEWKVWQSRGWRGTAGFAGKPVQVGEFGSAPPAGTLTRTRILPIFGAPECGVITRAEL